MVSYYAHQVWQQFLTSISWPAEIKQHNTNTSGRSSSQMNWSCHRLTNVAEKYRAITRTQTQTDNVGADLCKHETLEEQDRVGQTLNKLHAYKRRPKTACHIQSNANCAFYRVRLSLAHRVFVTQIIVNSTERKTCLSIEGEQDTQTRFLPVTLTLTRWPWCTNMTRRFWRCSCVRKMNFLGQDFQKFNPAFSTAGIWA